MTVETLPGDYEGSFRVDLPGRQYMAVRLRRVDTRVRDVRFEHHREPLGIGEPRPRMSWKVATDIPAGRSPPTRSRSADADVRPDRVGRVRARRLGRAAARLARAARACACASGDPATARATWSEPADGRGRAARAGGLDGARRSRRTDAADEPVALLRREFELRGEVAVGAAVRHRARRVRGSSSTAPRVGDHVLAPGWTSYHHRLRYQTFDVTDAARARAPTRSARMLADGWYRGRLGFDGGRRNIYGDRTGAARAARDRATPTARRSAFGTDGDWRAATGPDRSPRASTTARPTTPGASAPAGRRRATTTRGWAPVRELEHDPARAGRADRPAGAPHASSSRRSPITTSPSGRDARRLRAEPGRPAADPACRRPAGHDDHAAPRRGARGRRAVHPAAARGARATDAYTLRGGGVEDWEPRFTFHGFRYAEVDGWPGELEPGDRWPRSSAHRHGAHRLVRLLRPAAQPAARERRLGHARQLPRRARPTARSATSGSAGPATSRSSRPPPPSSTTARASSPPGWPTSPPSRATTGVVPLFVPFVDSTSSRRSRLDGPTAAWGDAAVIVPWVLYERFGDRELLAAQFDSMRAWVDDVAARAGATRCSGTAASSSATGSTRPRRRTPGRRAHRPAPGRHRLPRPLGRAARAARRTCWAASRGRERYRALAARRPRARSAASTSRPRPARATPQTALRAGAGVRPAADAEQREHAGRRLAELVRGRRLPHRHRLRRHAAHLRRADARRRARHRLPPAAAARVPVLAVPGDDGRDDDLGALGQPAPGRHGQPGRDDLVQPLRARRGRRLAAPHRRRPRAGRARLPAARGSRPAPAAA